MEKADVLAKLEEYKDCPVVIGIGDEGICLWGGLEGHWLFEDGDCLTEIRANRTDTVYGVATLNQREAPFIKMTVPYDQILYVKGFLRHDAAMIAEALDGLTPVGTSKSMDDITKEITGNSILKVQSPTGNVNADYVEPGKAYGAFKGSYISTENGGIPEYIRKTLLDD